MSRRLRDPRTLVSRWPLQGNADDAMGRYPGTLVNTPTWGSFYKNNLQAIELDRDDAHVNCGDVAELSVVTEFTFAFWMYQDITPADDFIYRKRLDGTHLIQANTLVGGNMLFNLQNGGGSGSVRVVGYANYIPALNWHHIVVVYDGNVIAASNRFKIYFNGERIPHTLVSAIPVVSPDLTGSDLTLGAAVSSLDGRLHDFRIYNVALTNDEILKLIHMPVPTY